MTRRCVIRAAWLGVLAVVSCAPRARAAFPTVGDYDSAGRTNAVDADAAGVLGAFKARVADAFARGFGGVADFEAGAVSGNNVLDFDFGPGGSSKRLRLSASDNLGYYTSPFHTWVEPISGDRSLGSAGLAQGGSDPDLYFLPTALTGGAAGEALTEVAFTVLSREGAAQDVSATARFSDGSSSSLSASMPGVRGSGDTFFHFSAPAGSSVARVDLNFAGAGGPVGTALDDFAFVTSVVPEPVTAPCLIAVAALALAARRRRRPVV